MHLLTTTSAVLSLLTTAHAAAKTSIYIDQIPGYSQLAPCAENRVSAIVRAQASGCGDNQQLTSFSCFCIGESIHMSSMISTAVQNYCAAGATTLTASLSTALPEVTAAIEVFNSYCARSTELAWYQNNSTAPATVVITAAPSSSPLSSASSTPTSTSSPSTSKPVPVAAIAAPVVIGVLAIVGIIGLLFFLRRRKAAKKAGIYAPPTYTPRGELGHDEVQEVPSPAQEVMGDSVKYRYELETRPAELEGSKGPKSGNAGYRF